MKGKYPGIYITFKDVKDMSFEKCFDKIKELLSGQYDKLRHLLDTNTLSEVESIFFGLNNLDVCTILSNHFSSSFGFVEEEVKKILKDYNLEIKLDETKKWYNCYIFGKQVIHNP